MEWQMAIISSIWGKASIKKKNDSELLWLGDILLKQFLCIISNFFVSGVAPSHKANQI